MNLRNWIKSRMEAEHGWALMDALASSVIVIVAFSASMAMFNTATRSSAREAMRMQATQVAQQQLNWMRSLGQQDLSAMEALNDTTRTITYRGATFKVFYHATDASITDGGNIVEPCSIARASAPDTQAVQSSRPFTLMRVEVKQAGKDPAGSQDKLLADMQSKFSPETSPEAAKIGMLRVYVLDSAGAADPTVTDVTLTIVKDGVTETIQKSSSNPSYGCFLFKDLAAGQYTIKVASANLQNIYLNGSSGVIESGYSMPTGVLRSTTVTLSQPVNVNPVFKFMTGASTSANLIASDANRYTADSSGRPYWQALHTTISNPPNGNYFFSGENGMFLPTSSGVNTKLYPTTTQYSVYAGGCRVNDPSIGSALTNRTSVPDAITNATWVSNGTLSPAPELWLDVVKPNLSMTAGTKPSSIGFGLVGGDISYWNRAITNVQYQVAIDSASNGSSPQTQCHPNLGTNLATARSNWVRVPGSYSSAAGFTNNSAMALPPGRYKLCYRASISWSEATWGGFIILGLGSTRNLTGLAFGSSTVSVGYKAVPTSAPALDMAGANHSAKFASGISDSSSTCGNPALWG